MVSVYVCAYVQASFWWSSQASDWCLHFCASYCTLKWYLYQNVWWVAFLCYSGGLSPVNHFFCGLLLTQISKLSKRIGHVWAPFHCIECKGTEEKNGQCTLHNTFYWNLFLPLFKRTVMGRWEGLELGSLEVPLHYNVKANCSQMPFLLLYIVVYPGPHC